MTTTTLHRATILRWHFSNPNHDFLLWFQSMYHNHYCSENSFWLSQSFIFSFSIIHKYYRQVLTLVNNSQLLLKLPILGKFRLVTFHSKATQRNYNIRIGLLWFKRNESSHDLDSKHASFEDELCQLHAIFTIQCFHQLRESASLSHHEYFAIPTW